MSNVHISHIAESIATLRSDLDAQQWASVDPGVDPSVTNNFWDLVWMNDDKDELHWFNKWETVPGASTTYKDTTFNDISVNADLSVGNAIYGLGDGDTYLDFSTADKLSCEIGGVTFFDFVEQAGQDYVHWNTGQSDIDFRWDTSGQTYALFLQGSDGFLGIHESEPAVELEISTASPEMWLHNTDETDANLGRACAWVGRGEQSGGEESSLGAMAFNHDGSSDDEKGQWMLAVNSGSDGDNPTVRMTVDSSGNVGIGVIPAQKFEIGSTDNSDRLSLYHDNGNGYITVDDGGLYFKSVESANISSYFSVAGNGTGIGYIRIFDEDDAEFIEMYCTAGTANIKVAGVSPNVLSLQGDAETNISMFSGSSEGETKELIIGGYRTGDAYRTLSIGVGVDADDTASFDGVSNYYFDGKVGIGITPGDEAMLDVKTDPGLYGHVAQFWRAPSVSHGCTDVMPTDAFAALTTVLSGTSAAAGGALLTGISDDAATPGIALRAVGIANPTDAYPIMRFAAGVASGTSWAACGNAETAFQFLNYSTELLTILGNGDTTLAGSLHIYTSDAGSVTANTNADDFIIESSASSGMSFLGPDDCTHRIFFGVESDNDAASIIVDHAEGVMYIASAAAGNSLNILSGGKLGIMGAGVGSIQFKDITYTAMGMLIGGNVKGNVDAMEIMRSGNAADMDGTATSILFRQQYYDASTPDWADLGQLQFETETDWTSTASTQDGRFKLNVVENGSLTTQLQVDSDGLLTQRSGAYLKLGQATTAGTVSADGTIPIKDSAGNTIYLLYSTTAAT